LDQRLQCSPVHHVTRTVEELVDVEFQPGVLKDAHRSVLVELYQHVDVTFRAAFAACHRTEYCGMCHSKPPQISLVGAQCFQRVLEIQSHSPPRVLRDDCAPCRLARTALVTIEGV